MRKLLLDPVVALCLCVCVCIGLCVCIYIYIWGGSVFRIVIMVTRMLLTRVLLPLSAFVFVLLLLLLLLAAAAALLATTTTYHRVFSISMT